MTRSERNKNRSAVARFVRYMQETWQNKLIAIALVMTGMLPVYLDRDATALVLMMFFAVPMFFSRRKWTY